MPSDRHRSNDPAAIRRRAADWLVARDRGLTAVEQDDYLQWLAESPDHAAAMAKQQAFFQRLMRLEESEPANRQSDPDLIAPAPRISRPWRAAAVASAAMLAGLLAWRIHPAAVSQPAAASALGCLRTNLRQILADGSVVELKERSEIEVRESATERRVILKRGEAYFTVVHNAARPFVVQAGTVGIRDVGTVFNVRLEPERLEVLVTEGRVRVDRAHLPEIRAGQRAVIPLPAGAADAWVEQLNSGEMADALVWQKPRFEFSSTPLAEAVADFNRQAGAGSASKLVLGDPELAAVRIGGTVRTDDVQGFVRLLNATFGIRGERQGAAEIVLKRGR